MDLFLNLNVLVGKAMPDGTTSLLILFLKIEIKKTCPLCNTFS